MKKLAWVGVLLSGCLLPSVEVDPSLSASGGDSATSAGTHGGGASNKAGAQNGNGGSVISPDNGGAGADEPVGGAGASGTETAGTPGIGGADSAGTGGSGGSGTLGEQQGPFTLFRVSVLPNLITQGPDGNFWFTEGTGTQIGRITPKGDVKLFDLPEAPSLAKRNLLALVSGPDAALWFTDFEYKQVGRMSLDGKFTFYDPPTMLNTVRELVNGPDGNLWGTAGYDDLTYRLTPAGNFEFFPAKSNENGVGPGAMVAGKDTVFAAMSGRAQIASVDKLGAYTFLKLTDTATRITGGIALSDDNKIWYSDYNKPCIGKMSGLGPSVEYSLPAGNSPSQAVAGRLRARCLPAGQAHVVLGRLQEADSGDVRRPNLVRRPANCHPAELDGGGDE